MQKPLVTGKNTPVLRTVCDAVTKFDGDLKNLVEDLRDTMTNKNEYGQIGIGIAAPQIGVTKRVMLVTFGVREKGKKSKIVVMVNPEIVSMSDDLVTMEEGCLSLPNQFGNVRRPSKVVAKWQTVDGNWSEKKLSGWDARIFLHELDHLNGVLFIDRMKQKKF